MDPSAVNPWKSSLKPCSDVELTKSLALLGFGSWTALEPSMLKILPKYNNQIGKCSISFYPYV